MTSNLPIYFVENILFDHKEKCEVILWKIPKELILPQDSNLEEWENIEIITKNVPLDLIYNYSQPSNAVLREGSYVYTDDDPKIISFENANGDPIARRTIIYNNLLRSLGLKEYLSRSENNNKGNYEEVDEVYSYHINVGHGNCSIIVFRQNEKVNIWMIDCSIYDFLQKKYFTSNLSGCIKHIKNKFHLECFIINRFFLTHPHFDHFNGIKHLINKTYLTKSEVWINFHFSWPQSQYNEILKLLRDNGNNYKEPIISNSTNNISILHPIESLIRQTKIKPNGQNINNSSAVYWLGFNGKSIVLPGDLEKEGWNETSGCFPYMNNCTYYCISHHGSKNGHVRTECPQKIMINSLADCTRQIEYALLMGRDKAFSGVFSSDVLLDYDQKLIIVESKNSSDPNMFIELNWQDNKCSEYKSACTVDPV